MAPIAFPIKLWNAVNSDNGLITWANDGESIIVNESCFDSIVTKRLPNFLRTPSLFSLRRSLRWYNFVCSENLDHGFSRYWHPYFLRDREDLLSRVTIGRKRSLAKSWWANTCRTKTGSSNSDDEYSADMQLSQVAMTSGNSILPLSFRQKLDYDSCDCMIDPCRFQDGAALWSGANGNHLQRHQSSNVKCHDSDETYFVNNVYPSSEANYPYMASNSTLLSDASVIDCFAADSNHLMFSPETTSCRDGNGDLGASTICHHDNRVYFSEFVGTEYLRPGQYEELIQPTFLSDVVGSELHCELTCLTCLEEGFALTGVPAALTNDLASDHWPVGETRSYFAL